ncbi:hypothetical protein BDN71DRAFT_1503071 [Pleurotus eryngii]|uniref:Uncharacterized protein n=1 Tax=Pleurotus eryngii TaxID=5323 RepID=A0A9P6A5E5_PLEER|nr:hypothetical protein BDN71DRAFT_1503071 [Pleurotus eryngii]
MSQASTSASVNLSIPEQECPVVRVVGRGGLGSRPRTHKSQPSIGSAASASALGSIEQRLAGLRRSSVIDIRHEATTSSLASGSSDCHDIPSDRSKHSASPESMFHPPTSAVIRFSGRGGAGSRLRVIERPESALVTVDSAGAKKAGKSSTAAASTSSSSQPSSPPVTPVIRVSGRGGAGSRPRQVKLLKSKPSKRKLEFNLKWMNKDKRNGKQKETDFDHRSLHATSVRSGVSGRSAHNLITQISHLKTPVYHHHDPLPSTSILRPWHSDTFAAAMAANAELQDGPGQGVDFQIYTTMQTYGSAPLATDMPVEILVTITTTITLELAADSKASRILGAQINVDMPLHRSLPSLYESSILSSGSEYSSSSVLEEVEEATLEDTWIIDDLYEPDLRPVSTILFSEPLPGTPLPPTPKPKRDSDSLSDGSDTEIHFAPSAATTIGLDAGELNVKSLLYRTGSVYSDTPSISPLGSTLDLPHT